jgi:sugar lactone lactonase YvrE
MMDQSSNLEPYAEHDGGVWSPVNCGVAATWPVGSFAENLAVHPDGTVYVSLHYHRRIDRYHPATRLTETFADLPAPPMGLTFDSEGALWVTGGEFPNGPGSIWKIAADRIVQQWAELPDALFINGCTMHPNGRTLLACESLTGRLLAVDVRKPGRWSAWLTHDLLKPGGTKSPGANGVKIRNGWAWISVSGRRLVVRVPINQDGSSGPIETVARGILVDDFAFGESGALYMTTHSKHTVVRLDPSGERATLVGPDEGAAGSTACAFGRGYHDTRALYVTTNGGLFAPLAGGVQESKLLRLDVGEPGWSESERMNIYSGDAAPK